MKRSLAALVLSLAAACGGGGGSGGGGGGSSVVAGDPLLESITTSDAVVGGKGRILVTLRNTVGKDAEVTLTSASGGAATIPGTLKVVAGSKIGEVEYDGTAPGNFLVSAAVNGTQFTATGNVVSAMKVSSVGGSTRLQKGAGAVLTVSMNMVLPKDTEVALTSSNPATIAVPAKVTVPAFRSFAQVAMSGAGVGSTTITATLSGQSVAQVFRPELLPLVEDGFTMVNDPRLALVYLDQRYDRRRVDGLWMSADQADDAVDRLRAMNYEQRAANGCIGHERADLVLAGCAILEAIRRAFPAPRIRIADRGLREGILLELMRADRAGETGA